ncbi:hypothetical protein PGT21_023764 [Puccinia graminis f. sp. tritici]|uniref:Uncharacterized protein n=1 Tax=Puccinia graminis f. sp. tritici TaxID=56615 RepID=A0A5B0NH43_PUCGR|nr:hypothetical protein PGT21_023764 [Puccinia graminis f. sp. tritici]
MAGVNIATFNYPPVCRESDAQHVTRVFIGHCVISFKLWSGGEFSRLGLTETSRSDSKRKQIDSVSIEKLKSHNVHQIQAALIVPERSLTRCLIQGCPRAFKPPRGMKTMLLLVPKSVLYYHC